LSDTIFKGMVIIPYIRGVSKKFGLVEKVTISGPFSKHTLFGILMKTGLVRDFQQMKQFVYNIPCNCDNVTLVNHADR
jgi:hypothetical protein